MKALVLLLLTISFSLNAQILTFKLDGKEVHSVFKKEMATGGININGKKIKESETKLFNAWRGYEKEYVGYNFTYVLDLVYGPQWKESKRIVLKALDGYSPFINTKKMIKAMKENKNHGFISYSEMGKDGFTKFKRGEKSVDPGPFYIVWSNFTEEDKATYGDILKWPYQLKEINLVLK